MLTGATAGHAVPPSRSRRGRLLWPAPVSPGASRHGSADLRQRKTATLPAHDERSLQAMADQLRALSDLELCRAWRRSFVELDAAAGFAGELAKCRTEVCRAKCNSRKSKFI